MMPTITNTLERLNALLNDKSIDSMLYGLSASTQQLHGMMAGLNRTSRSLGPRPRQCREYELQPCELLRSALLDAP